MSKKDKPMTAARGRVVHKFEFKVPNEHICGKNIIELKTTDADCCHENWRFVTCKNCLKARKK